MRADETYLEMCERIGSAINGKDERIAELEAALGALVSASADVETGRMVHNDRHRDDRIEGPVWTAMADAVHAARTALRKSRAK